MQIEWTKGARQNLEQIEEYIAQDNPLAAIDTVLNIIQTIELLKTHPGMGRAGRLTGTRELIITNAPYIVPYRVKNKSVQILRVLHGSIQWPSHP